jgi:hypothetical protein
MLYFVLLKIDYDLRMELLKAKDDILDVRTVELPVRSFRLAGALGALGDHSWHEWDAGQRL